MNAQEIIQAESHNVLQTYVRPDIVFSHGEGMYLYDSEGNKYLDLTSGIAVTALGHSDPDWVTAVSTQAAQLAHVSNLYHTAPQAELAEKLVNNSFADKVYFCNSGAEANEAAIKLARKYFYDQGRPERFRIISMAQSFHGRTMATLSATGQEKIRKGFDPVLDVGLVTIPQNGEGGDISGFELAAAVHAVCAARGRPLLRATSSPRAICPALSGCASDRMATSTYVPWPGSWSSTSASDRWWI